MHEVEKKILDNLAYFNDNKPDDGHEARFVNRMNNTLVATPKKLNIPIYIKIAATLLVLFATSYLVLTTISKDEQREEIGIKQIVYSEELYKVQTYYDDLSTLRMDRIDELALSKQQAHELKSIAIKKMDKLDANLAMIEKEYVKNPQCEKLKAAIVNNKKAKVKVVDNIVDQLANIQQGYHAGSVYTNY